MVFKLRTLGKKSNFLALLDLIQNLSFDRSKMTPRNSKKNSLTCLSADTSSLGNGKELEAKIFDLLKTLSQNHTFTEFINLVNKGDGEVALLK